MHSPEVGIIICSYAVLSSVPIPNLIPIDTHMNCQTDASIHITIDVNKTKHS